MLKKISWLLLLTACTSNNGLNPAIPVSQPSALPSRTLLPAETKPTQKPSISPLGDFSSPKPEPSPIAPKYSSVSFVLKASDWNTPNPDPNCGPSVDLFSIISHGGYSRFNPQSSMLNGFIKNGFTQTYQKAFIGSTVDIRVPANYQHSGVRMFEPIYVVAQVTEEPQTIPVNVPVRVWPESNLYRGNQGQIAIASSTLPKVEQIQPGDQVYAYSLPLGNRTAISWKGLELVNIDPVSNYLKGSNPYRPVGSSTEHEIGQNGIVNILFLTPNRSGKYRTNWMFKDKSSGIFQFSDQVVYLDFTVEEKARFTPKESDDSYLVQDSLTINSKKQEEAFPGNEIVIRGTSFDLYYQLKNTGNKTWLNRKLQFQTESIKSEDRLKPNKLSLDVPPTKPGETAKIGPVTFFVPTLQSHFAAWKMIDAAGMNHFEGDYEAVTQITPIPPIAYCK